MKSGLFKVDHLWCKAPYNVTAIKENQQTKKQDFLHLFHHNLFITLHFSASTRTLLYSLPLPHPFLSPSVLKGQTFPAVTIVPHWYSAVNLAESRTAVSASSDHTEIRHGVRT